MKLEVVYIGENGTFHVHLELPINSTAEEAIIQSQFLAQHPFSRAELENKLGIFGKRCHLNTVLQEGDRLEIYESLIVSPKEARRKRARFIANEKRGSL